MSYHCFKCSAEIQLTNSTAVGRRDECPKCGHDLHICRNCRHWERSAWNECREPQAERVLEKERSNFCDWFDYRAGPGGSAPDTRDKTLRDLDDLFKK